MAEVDAIRQVDPQPYFRRPPSPRDKDEEKRRRRQRDQDPNDEQRGADGRPHILDVIG